MTCGIYRLIFTGTDRVYIGQSVNIEKRFSQHCRNLLNKEATSKLQEAYDTYGVPSLDILTECPHELLDDYETEAIEIFDAVAYGYNTYVDVNQAPTYTGHGYGNSKYSKKEILDTVNLLINNPSMSYTDISKISQVNMATVQQLSSAATHQWVWDEYPELHISITAVKSTRTIATPSDKLSAKSKGIIYPTIKDPSGEVFYIDNAYKFAKDRGLAPNHFQEVLNGHRKSHKGWKLA